MLIRQRLEFYSGLGMEFKINEISPNPIVLSKILASPWSQLYTGKVLKYYQSPTRVPKRYGLYSSGLDRFLLVDGLDLWTLRHAAQLLSSKIATVICVFTSEEPTFQLENCLTWSLVQKQMVVPKKQTPDLHLVHNNDEILQEGLPFDFLDNIEEVVEDQEFAIFVLRAAYALRLTDLLVSSSALAHNEDQGFYTDFFADILQKDTLHSVPDKTLWNKGFSGEIGRILYRSQSIAEVLRALTESYTNCHPDESIPTSKFGLRANIYRKFYLNRFFEFFGWRPENV